MRISTRQISVSFFLGLALVLSPLYAAEQALTPGEIAYQEAQNYAAHQNPQKALEAINRALKANPNHPNYLQAKAQYANWVGKGEEAEAAYRRILFTDPKNTEALFRMAQLYSWQGRYGESEEYFERALQEGGDQKEIWLAYASERSWRGQSYRAIGLLDQYDKKFGADDDSKAIRAKALLWGGFPKKAQSVERSMSEKSQNSFDRLYVRSMAHHARREYRDAQKVFQALKKEYGHRRETSDVELYVDSKNKSDVYLRGEFYRDADDLQLVTGKLGSHVRVNPGFSIEGWGAFSWLHAPISSGLNHINGSESAYHTEGRFGARFLLDPTVEAFLEMGGAQTEGDDVLAYRGQLDFRPNDVWHFLAFRDQGYFLISPRAVSLGIERALNELQMTIHPSLRWQISTIGSYMTLSDDNARLLGQVWPQYYLFAYAPWYLDIGLRGSWQHFSKRLFNGYYAPDLFQSYMGTGRLRYRSGDNSTAELLVTAGALKDDFIKGVKFGWSAEAYWGVGLVSSWMLELTAGYIENLRQATGSFKMGVASATLTRRF